MLFSLTVLKNNSDQLEKQNRDTSDEQKYEIFWNRFSHIIFLQYVYVKFSREDTSPVTQKGISKCYTKMLTFAPDPVIKERKHKNTSAKNRMQIIWHP